MDIFEKASRKKLRFPSSVGDLTTEQLWDLPLVSTAKGKATLDAIARNVNANLKSVTEESFVDVRPNPLKADYELQLDILKHVIAVKIAEAEAAKSRAEKAAKRSKILEALAAKEDAELGAKSKDDLLKELADLDA